MESKGHACQALGTYLRPVSSRPKDPFSGAERRTSMTILIIAIVVVVVWVTPMTLTVTIRKKRR